MPRRRKRTKPELLEAALLPRRDMVLFPNVVTPLVVRHERPLRAIEDALLRQRTVVVVARKDGDPQEMTLEDLYGVGTEAAVGRAFKMPDGTSTVWVEGQRRVQITEIVQRDPYLTARATLLEEPQVEKTALATVALMRAVLALFEKVVKLSTKIPEDAYVAAMNVDEPGWLGDLVTSSLDLDLCRRQEILECLHPIERLQKVSILLAQELDVLELENRIHAQVQKEVDKTQREYYLREQIRVIEKELGEVDPQTREAEGLRRKIADSGMPEAVCKKAEEELTRLLQMPPMAPEVAVIRTYLDWLVSLPWATSTQDNLDLKRAAKVLEANHYGLPKVKERILEYIAVRKLAAEKLRSPILCFVGAPGVGKTSLGRSIAQALGRRFVRVSLGGIRDEAEIRGHRRTYVGALPGRIIQTMRQAGGINPVFMLDEIDKVGIDFRGDPSSALLEVLDPEQNHAFSDHYLDVPYDLSRVMFITTANVLDPVLPALRDRMEVIELPGYTEEEKLHIALRFLVHRQLREHGLVTSVLRFTPSSLRRIIREYTREAGVRNLEREISTICRKVARLVAEGEAPPGVVTAKMVSNYLGPPEYFWGTAEEKDQVGVATGVARTEMGGDVMGVEVTLMEGKGQLILTGQLGEVMRESAQAALSYTRSRASQLGIKPSTFEKTDIHIHVPSGAVPKDGPSAGITLATALVSALTHQPVHREVAMTGEITLRGRVLPVGGIKEKVLAAHRAGIKTFVMPRKNLKDLEEIPLKVRKDIGFVFAEDMGEVLSAALVTSANTLRAVQTL